MEYKHKSVMLREVLDVFELNNEKTIIDGTAGGGGHTSEIAKTAKKVIAIDKDPDAVANLKNKFADSENVVVVEDDFVNMKDVADSLGIDKVEGILLDLGVSSFQLDNSERGFSYHKDAPLDMRMSKSGLSAEDVVNNYSEEALEDIIFRYGEEKYARSIAANIVKARHDNPISTTFELVDIIKRSMPAYEMRKKHPAKKTFQAIRIEVNGELDSLDKALDNAFDILSSGGIIAIITFHSLEDRMVKLKFSKWIQGCTCPKEFPVCICGNKPKGYLPFKFKRPSEAELEENPRSHSATLRAFVKY